MSTKPHSAAPESWVLRLYIAGHTQKSSLALANLKRICQEHLAGRYEIEVIDLHIHPNLAVGHQIIAIPTLVRMLPHPLSPNQEAGVSDVSCASLPEQLERRPVSFPAVCVTCRPTRV